MPYSHASQLVRPTISLAKRPRISLVKTPVLPALPVQGDVQQAHDVSVCSSHVCSNVPSHRLTWLGTEGFDDVVTYACPTHAGLVFSSRWDGLRAEAL